MTDTKQNQQEHQTIFKVNDIVWSRVVGFPWWPSQILEGPDQISGKYKVLFLNDYSYAWLPSSKIVDYYNDQEKYMAPKKKIKGFAIALGRAIQQIRLARKKDQEQCFSYDDLNSNGGEQIEIQLNKQQENNKSIYQEQRKCNKKISESRHIIKARKIISKQNSDRMIPKPRKALQKKQYSAKTIEYVENLLQKYRFSQIQQLQHEYKFKKQQFARKGSKINRFKKNKHQQEFDQLEIRKKVIRKLSFTLRRKGIINQQNYFIATFLGNSLLQQRENKVTGAHRALFQWIAANDHKNIVDSYRSWHGTAQKFVTGFTEGNSDSKSPCEEQ